MAELKLFLILLKTILRKSLDVRCAWDEVQA
jgi:hypothetical protein